MKLMEMSLSVKFVHVTLRGSEYSVLSCEGTHVKSILVIPNSNSAMANGQLAEAINNCRPLCA